MTHRTPEEPFTRLSVVEAGMMADDILADIALGACARLVRQNPTYKEQPGRLAEAVDELTGVGFETAVFIALSPAVERIA